MSLCQSEDWHVKLAELEFWAFGLSWGFCLHWKYRNLNNEISPHNLTMDRNMKRLHLVSFNPPSSPWCNVTSQRQPHAGHFALRGGKSGLSNMPIFPQPLCCSKQHNQAKNPKLTQVEHTCSCQGPFLIEQQLMQAESQKRRDGQAFIILLCVWRHRLRS